MRRVARFFAWGWMLVMLGHGLVAAWWAFYVGQYPNGVSRGWFLLFTALAIALPLAVMRWLWRTRGPALVEAPR